MSRILLFCSAFILFTFSCGKDSDPRDRSSASPKNRIAARSRIRSFKSPGKASFFDSTKDGKKDYRKQSYKNKEKDKKVFLPNPAKAPRGRMLEYSVSLVIRSTNLATSRTTLLAIIPAHGFLTRSSFNAGYSTPYHSLTCRIQTDKLYQALTKMATCGKLISENIRVTDHTEDRFINSVRARRADLRMHRYRGRRTAKTEGFLRSAEDSRDDTIIRKWRLNDRINWATVSITLRGPKRPAKVSVPSLREKLVETANWLLELIFSLIPLLPIIIIAIPVWIKRKKIRQFFRRKKNKGSE